MRTRSFAVVAGLCGVLLLSGSALAQKRSAGRASGAETALAGIRLFDSGTRVVSIYGSPDAIEAVTLGGGAAGPGGGAAGGAGGAALPGGAGGSGISGGGAPGAAGGPMERSISGFEFGNSVLNRQGGVLAPQPLGGGANQGGGRTVGGAAGLGAGAPGGGGGGGNTGGATGDVQYTRWVYNRKGAKFGFIFDKSNRVVQCEAIGITSGTAKTRRGVTFGTSFASIIKKYGAPDGYEIMSDNTLIVRYLNKAKCAFRMSRLGENKPHVVTGIVVAAGKR